MGDKSEQKKQLIVDAARQVFAEKGFAGVTMKDIIEASQISRGGIYLYFDSTASIFAEILKQEQERPVFAGEILEEAAAVDLLLLFLKEQKKDILRKKENLSVATYEYCFANRLASLDNPVRRRFKEMLDVLTQLIEMGVSEGEFYCEDPAAEAANILYLLEGLRVSAHTIGLTEAKIDSQLLQVVQRLVIE